jgi:hypothetical protein
VGVTLDAGALIALEAGARRVDEMIRRAVARQERISIPCGVLAQVWRGTARQAVIVRLVKHPATELVPLTPTVAKAVGVLCARSGVTDVVDVSVVLCARQRGDRVLTSDVGDLRRIDPRLPVIAV